MDFEQYFCTFNKWSSILFNQPVSEVSLLHRCRKKTRLHAELQPAVPRVATRGSRRESFPIRIHLKTISARFVSPQLIPVTHPHISLMFANENVRWIMPFCAVNWTDRREGRDRRQCFELTSDSVSVWQLFSAFEWQGGTKEMIQRLYNTWLQKFWSFLPSAQWFLHVHVRVSASHDFN